MGQFDGEGELPSSIGSAAMFACPRRPKNE